MFQIIFLVMLATIFSGLACVVGKTDKNAHSIFTFWSFIIFGGSFGAVILYFLPIFLLHFAAVIDFPGFLGFFVGGLLGSFLGWKYAIR